MGNQMRGGWYWRTEEERRCRVCGGEEESWEHVLDRCSTKRGEERTIGERLRKILDEEGRGEERITEIEQVRRERSASEGEERGRGEEKE